MKKVEYLNSTRILVNCNYMNINDGEVEYSICLLKGNYIVLTELLTNITLYIQY